jgi:hypothetical protein
LPTTTVAAEQSSFPGGATGFSDPRAVENGVVAVLGLTTVASPAKAMDHVEPATRQVAIRGSFILDLVESFLRYRGRGRSQSGGERKLAPLRVSIPYRGFERWGGGKASFPLFFQESATPRGLEAVCEERPQTARGRKRERAPFHP